MSTTLDKEDLRFFAIGNLNTGVAIVATTEKIGNKIIDFGLPSSVAIFLNLAANARNKLIKVKIDDCFNTHSQGIWPDDHKLLFDYFELMIAQITFSYTAIETFSSIIINQKAPENFVHTYTNKEGKKMEFNKEQTERLNLNVKLTQILPKLLNILNPEGKNIWTDFRNHEKLRNRLIHLKSIDMRASGPEDQTIWGDLLRCHEVNYPGQVHELLGYYLTNSDSPRWYKEFPYHKQNQ